MPHRCVWIGMGGNMGDVEQTLASARAALRKRAGTLAFESSIYETAPWGLTTQSTFLNQVVGFVPWGSPEETLREVQSIEHAHGRQREIKWGPRTLDLDLLCWPDGVVETVDLVLPRPGLATRRFVLEPLVEVAPNLVPYGHRQTVSELLAACNDSGWVRRCS